MSPLALERLANPITDQTLHRSERGGVSTDLQLAYEQLRVRGSSHTKAILQLARQLDTDEPTLRRILGRASGESQHDQARSVTKNGRRDDRKQSQPYLDLRERGYTHREALHEVKSP
jgi:hypothetical protein